MFPCAAVDGAADGRLEDHRHVIDVPEQVIDVPKHYIPQRAVLQAPQLAEQLEDVPTPHLPRVRNGRRREEEIVALVTDTLATRVSRSGGHEVVHWWPWGPASQPAGPSPEGAHATAQGGKTNTGRSASSTDPGAGRGLGGLTSLSSDFSSARQTLVTPCR